MAGTLNLTAYSSAFPLITNDIRVDISTQENPLAIVASQTVSSPHPVRLWSFPGLPRTNYVFQMNEIVASIPVYQLAYFDVVPGDLTAGIWRGEEQIKVDITPGLVSGATSFTFDGSGGTASTVVIFNQTDSAPPGGIAVIHHNTYFDGVPAAGDMITATFTYSLNDIDPPTLGDTITSTALAGWDLETFIDDLVSQISATGFPSVSNNDYGGGQWRLHLGAWQLTCNVVFTASISGDAKPDWVGWEISPEEYDGVGTLIRGSDYSWDKVTGTFAYLQAGQVFMPGQWFTVEFEAQTGGANSVPVFTDFSMRIITADETLVPDDFGTKILVEPAGDYLELTLPPLALVATGRYLMLESETSQSFKCIKILPDGTDIINFLHGSLYMMLNETLYIYRLTAGERDEWRVCSEVGNFIHCGEIVSDDLTNVFNKVLADGGAGDGLDIFQYARLYNEVVLRLPVIQRVNYDSWAGNQTFYSLANSSNPSFLNKFRIPNRLGLIEKANPIGRLIGSYEPDSVGTHAHNYLEEHAESYTGGPTSSIAGGGANNITPFSRITLPTGTGISDETVMKNYSVNKFILV